MLNSIRIISRVRNKYPVVDLIFGSNQNESEKILLYLSMGVLEYAQRNFAANPYVDRVKFSLPFKHSVRFSLIFPNRRNVKKFVKYLKEFYSR